MRVKLYATANTITSDCCQCIAICIHSCLIQKFGSLPCPTHDHVLPITTYYRVTPHTTVYCLTCCVFSGTASCELEECPSFAYTWPWDRSANRRQVSTPWSLCFYELQCFKTIVLKLLVDPVWTTSRSTTTFMLASACVTQWDPTFFLICLCGC